MKKLLSLLTAVLFAGSMMAGEASIDFSAQDYENQQVVESCKSEHFYVTFDQGASNIAPTYYTSGTAIRCYGGSSFTVTCEIAMSRIEITFGSNDGTNEITADPGIFRDHVWEENKTATSVTFTISGTTGHRRIKSIKVTYEGGMENGQESVDFSEQGYSNQQVVQSYNGVDFEVSFDKGTNSTAPTYYNSGMAIRCYGGNTFSVGSYMEMSQIKLTFGSNDGTNAITTNTGTFSTDTWEGNTGYVKFTIGGTSGNRRIQGIQVTFNTGGNPGGDDPVYSNCSDVYSMAKNDEVHLNDVRVTHINGTHVWVKDESGAMLLFLPKSTTVNWKAGDVLSNVAGLVDIYQSIVYEVVPSPDQVAAVTVSHGEAPQPVELSTITAADVNKYIVMKGVTAEGAFVEGQQSNITINGVTVRNQFKNAYTFVAGIKYDVVGVVSGYNGAAQVYFISASESSKEGINNAAVAGKTVKSLRKGVLVIEKNGIRYNALGQIVE